MNFKRVSAAALALVMAASLGSAALASELPEGWTPADGARMGAADGALLDSPNPNAGETEVETGAAMPEVSVPAPNGGYSTRISVNGKALEEFEFEYEVTGWGTTKITWRVDELDTVPAGYVPMRAITQADFGTCYWDPYANESCFFLQDHQIIASFNDQSVSVDGEKVEGAASLLLNGVTYLPVSVLADLDCVEVTDSSADGVEVYDIKTPNGEPLVMMAHEIMGAANMGMGMRATPAEFEEFYGEAYGFKAEYMTDGIVFLPMMTSPDTLVLGKFAEGSLEDLQECLEAYRKSQEETFSWYLSHNLPKVEDARFVTSGEWFLFLIGENADEAVATFEAAVAALGE